MARTAKPIVLPCKACGSKRPQLEAHMHGGTEFHHVQCKCGARGMSMVGPLLATENWNDRQRRKE